MSNGSNDVAILCLHLNHFVVHLKNTGASENKKTVLCANVTAQCNISDILIVYERRN